MAQTVVGIFDSATDAQNAVNQLVNNGFSRSSIDISATTDADTTTIGNTSAMGTTGMSSTDLSDQPLGGSTATRAADTAAARASDKDYSDRHDDSGSIGRFFSNLFGNDDDTDRTTRDNFTTVGQHDTIVTVHATDKDEAKRAADILDDFGAVDIDERAEQYRTGMTTGPTTTANLTTGTNQAVNTDWNAGADQTLKVVEENLQVGKRTVETGGVRVRSRIVEKPVEESLRLREERVRIQRTPVNRLATDADLTAFQQGDITLTERAEVPVVNKEARVVEEISVGKDVTERDEVIRDTVRNTDVEVENIAGQTTNTSTASATDKL